MPSSSSNRDLAPPDGTISRFVSLLRGLAEASGDVSVSGLADELRLPRSTVHRLLNLFRKEGLVTTSAASHRYEIGPELFRIASLITARRSIVDLAAPAMAHVVRESGETCILGLYLPHQREMVFAASVDSPNPLGYRITLHQPAPVVWGASGRAILAWLPDEEQENIMRSHHDESAEGEALDVDELRRDLADTRRRGYSRSAGQRVPGSYGIAAPIFEGNGTVCGSLCITMPKLRAGRGVEGRLGPLVVAGARRVSSLLGYDIDATRRASGAVDELEPA
jgi:DNA-binding IclR family transcriptional regulator